MPTSPLLRGAIILVVILIIGVLAVATQTPEDPCADPQSDISAAILANEHDGDALANRAILMRAECERRAKAAKDKPSAQLSGSPSGFVKVGNGSAGAVSAAEGHGEASATRVAPPATVPVESAADIIQHRCMVCHGCYDAPCQLKLEAQAGLLRGASKDLVYDGERLVAANMTRLFDDAFTTAQWREKGFYPVLDADKPEQGLMYRMLALKQEHPLPAEGPMPEGFDFSLARDQQCPKQDEFDNYAREKPLWGMPYGLPGLNAQQHATVTQWLKSGAPATALEPLSTTLQSRLEEWEAFLNGDSLQQRLVSRYIYEHLFLAALYLEESDQPVWFRLVRSRTPPGEPLDLISTRRPYDDPGVARVHYRLQRMPVTALDKIHIPYRFDPQRMDWYRSLFLEPEYEVTSLPGYDRKIASNPFKVFVDLPLNSRYRFLLEESRFTIMNFIKGPVCRGQVALNVIDDHFWVVFASPDRHATGEVDAPFLAREMGNMRLPTPKTGTVIDLLSWRRYAKEHERYQRAKSRFIRKQLAQGRRLELDSIWDGDGKNENASLTVFRHFDTATVETGLIGEVPKTAWVIDYPLLERIHYLLVAGFDVYGSLSHQLESRLYMDFLRMEGEFNFLLFMPPENRRPMWDHWYRDAPRGTRDHFTGRAALTEDTTIIEYSSDDPKTELLHMLKRRIHGARNERFIYRRQDTPSAMVSIFSAMESSIGAHNTFLPDVSFVNIIGQHRDEFYTLIRNSAHSNIAQLFGEDARRIPAEDSLTVVRGFLGAYPNYFFQVEEKELQRFAASVAGLESQADYNALRERYGVARNAPWFWRFVDKAHARYRWQNPIEYGLFDLNRYAGD